MTAFGSLIKYTSLCDWDVDDVVIVCFVLGQGHVSLFSFRGNCLFSLSWTEVHLWSLASVQQTSRFCAVYTYIGMCAWTLKQIKAVWNSSPYQVSGEVDFLSNLLNSLSWRNGLLFTTEAVKGFYSNALSFNPGTLPAIVVAIRGSLRDH